MKKLIAHAVASIALSSAAATAGAATCLVFSADIEGTTTGPYAAFQNTVHQMIIIRDGGARNNPFELLILYPGDPNAWDTQPGAIELMTNSMFARNDGMRSAQSDMGTIHRNEDGSISFILTPGAALQVPPPNFMAVLGPSSSPAGLGGICLIPGLSTLCQQTQQAPVLQLFYLIPDEGVFVFAFPGSNTIVGELSINGYGYGAPTLRGNYTARVNGVLRGQVQCA